jgi:hypothetical protein
MPAFNLCGAGRLRDRPVRTVFVRHGQAAEQRFLLVRFGSVGKDTVCRQMHGAKPRVLAARIATNEKIR